MKSFAKVIKWSLLTNKRYYIKQIVSLCVVFFVIMAAFTGMFDGYSSAVTARDAHNAASAIIFGWIIVTGIAAAHVAFDLKTKQQRTLYMMLPASDRTKFWSRVVLTSVFAYVVTPLTIGTADVVQMLVSQLCAGSSASVVAGMHQWFGQFIVCGNLDLSVIAQVSITAWLFSFFLLGGFLFRKLPFIMTIVAWIVLWTVVAVGIINAITSYDNCYIEFYWDKSLTIESIITLTGIAFTTINLWLASKVHKRMSVVSHNFLNI